MIIKNEKFRKFIVKNKLLILLTIILIGMGVRLPSLNIGFHSDDFFFLSMLEDVQPFKRAPWDLFNFASGDRAENQIQKNRGTIFWWSHPDVKLRFFRPLASLTYWIDFHVFRYDAFYWHIHSLIWWIFLILALYLLLREIFPLDIALLSLLLIALDDSSIMHTYWIAQRYATITTLFAVFSLLFYIQFRKTKSKQKALLSGISLLVSLLSGEYGLMIIAFMVFYDLFIQEGKLSEKFKFSYIYFLPALIYISTHIYMGYGVGNSDLYLSPKEDFLELIQQFPLRVLYLLGALFFSTFTFEPKIQAYFPFINSLNDITFYFGLFSLALIVLFLPVFISIIKKIELPSKKYILWMLLSGLSGLLVISPSFPHIRHLLIPGIGFSVLMAYMLINSKVLIIENKLRIIPITIFLVLHCIYTPYWLVSGTSGDSKILAILNLKSAYIGDKAHETENSKMIMVVAPIEQTVPLHLPMMRHVYQSIALPESFWVLSTASRGHKLTRIDEFSFDLIYDDSVGGEEFYSTDFERLFRSRKFSFRIGEIVQLDGMKAEIMELGKKSYPIRVRFKFDLPLENPKLRFGMNTKLGPRGLILPPVGETVILPSEF
ncbi:MAG: hypothetical protein IT569_02555 [Leptospiraceae bacterium]|nr:hypothetical protein [Leptospiraceae bacterium]